MTLSLRSIVWRLGLLLLLLGSYLPAHAVTDSLFTLKGKVVTPKNEGLLGANVSLLKADGKLQTGAITSQDGSYLLRAIPRGSYTLRISFVGYKTHSQTIQLTNKSLTLPSLILEEEGKELSAVQVVGKANEVTIKGDTLEYNAGSFTVNQGAVVADLVKKLPGATIDENGQITINGKVIKQIMVDGKRFFEGDPKVALNNLPAEVVQKVQVVDRESETSRLSGFSDGNDETVINLTIKPGKKRGLFGTAYVGGGTDKRYEGNLTLSRFADDNQFTILGSLNNTNNAGFSDISQDLSSTSFMMGLQGRGGKRRAGGGMPRFDANGILTSKVLGGNLNHTFSPKFSLNGNALVGNSKTDKQLARTQQNFLSTGSTTETGKSSELNDKDAYAANLRLEWKPDSLTELNFMPQIRIGHGRGTYSSTNETLEDATGARINSSTLLQSTLQDQLNTSLRMELSRRLNDRGRTLTLSGNFGLDRETGDGTYQSNTYNRSSSLSSVIDQRIESKSRTGSYRARLGYVEPLGKGYFTQLTYQINGSSARSQRDAFDADATGSYTSRNATYSNEFESSFLSHQVGLALKKKGKVYDLTAGINVTSSQLKSHSIVGGSATPDISRTTLNYSPTLRFSYKPERGTELRIDYSGRSFQPTNEQLSPVQDVTNPLVSYIGNPDLAPGFQHNLFGRFNKFFSASKTMLALFGHAQFVQNDIISRSRYDLTTGARTIDYTNVDGNGFAGFGGFVTQSLGSKFSLRLSSFNSFIRSNSFINGEKNRSHALRLREDLSLTYRHQGIDMSLRGVLGYYNASNTLPSATTPATKDYSLGYTSNIQLPLGFTFEGEATYTTSRGYASGFNQDQWLLNAGLSYSFLANKKATVRLKGYDLLDSRRSIYREITVLNSITEESNTLGRYVMLHFIYRFDSFSAGASKSDMKQHGRGPMGPPPF